VSLASKQLNINAGINVNIYCRNNSTPILQSEHYRPTTLCM